MSGYIDRNNFYSYPAVDGDNNWTLSDFISDVHQDESNRIFDVGADIGLESEHGDATALLFTRKKNYKIVETYDHHHMARPRFEKDICVSTAHIILITKAPYEGPFQEGTDRKWQNERDQIYKDHILYYNSYGYTVDIDYWLPRLRQYLHARYY